MKCCTGNCNQGRLCPNRKPASLKIGPWLVALLVVLALGIVGRMDADDAQLEADHYCEMVKAGHWPDYQGTYRTQCRRPIDGQR